jgi:2-polyprenyl-3-methyl-5-hydroxy-6-metoxy-1,4-benzoquinol methylase
MKQVKQFYNDIPFPDYELKRFEDAEDLKIKASQFAEMLNRSIPKDASIIDVGTGTGQLSAYLSIDHKCVYGIDFSETSLKKAKALRRKLKLKSWHLMKVDIEKPEEIKKINKKFDYLLCMGVLHHTTNAYQSFKNILPLLKDGGYICIGLYNLFGRIPLKLRKLLVRTVFKNNQDVKDYFMKLQIGEVEDIEKARGWWHDQYMHCHETSHTVGEVLRWFKKHDIKFLNTLPSTEFNDQSIFGFASTFCQDSYPNIFIRFYKQLFWIWRTHHEGGYWLTFGKHEKR